MDRRKFVAGLAGAGAATLARPRATRAQGGLTKLSVLIGTAPPDPASLFFYYARENGFYREHGIDIDLRPIGAETLALRALIAGEGDVSWCGGISTLQAIAAGSRLKVLSAFTPKLDYLVVGNREISGLKGFEGRTMAVSQVGAVSQLVPQLMMEQTGADASKVQWVGVGASAARVQALIARRVDGAPLNSSFAARVLQYEYLHVVGDAARDLPDFLYTWEVVAADAVERKRAALTSFVIATAKGCRWAMANPDAAAAISKKVLPDLPPAELDAAAREFAKKRFFSTTGKLPRATWDFTVATLVKLGNIKQPIRYEDVVLDDIVAAAMSQGGLDKP
jgi:NitT/TauT family transport system substrate-binding protein